MKKLVSCILLVIFLIPTAFAEATNANINAITGAGLVSGLIQSGNSSLDSLTDEQAKALLIALLHRIKSSEIVDLLTSHFDVLSEAEQTSFIASLQSFLNAQAESSEPASSSSIITSTPDISYATLQKGNKGADVQALQKRLIELNYLSGSADGDYGNKTKAAIELFQKAAGLPVNGIADSVTQEKLYASDAPMGISYLDLDYNAISRDPDSYEGKYYQFTGKVVQVMETDYSGYTFVELRIATKGNYDNIVYVMYERPKGAARILEDDRITVYGECTGLYTYETVMHSTVTLPCFYADTVTIK